MDTGFRFYSSAWEISLEGCPVSYFAENVNPSLMLFDDSINNRKSQAGPFTHTLGREKRLKDALHGLLAHARSIIRNRQAHKLSDTRILECFAILFVNVNIFGLYDDSTALLWHCVPCVH